MTKSRMELGRHGERIAKRYLQSKGMVIEDQNVRNRMGEIDIIARDDAYLVFVEVRTRRGRRYGTSLESVNTTKQRRLVSVARYYLAEKGMIDTLCRFDVIGIEWTTESEKPAISHIINAF